MCVHKSEYHVWGSALGLSDHLELSMQEVESLLIYRGMKFRSNGKAALKYGAISICLLFFPPYCVWRLSGILLYEFTTVYSVVHIAIEGNPFLAIRSYTAVGV